MELHRPVGETPIALAHSLAGSSATVGFTDLSHLARSLEHALARSQAIGHGTDRGGAPVRRRRRGDPPPAAPVRRRLPEGAGARAAGAPGRARAQLGAPSSTAARARRREAIADAAARARSADARAAGDRRRRRRVDDVDADDDADGRAGAAPARRAPADACDRSAAPTDAERRQPVARPSRPQRGRRRRAAPTRRFGLRRAWRRSTPRRRRAEAARGRAGRGAPPAHGARIDARRRSTTTSTRSTRSTPSCSRSSRKRRRSCCRSSQSQLRDWARQPTDAGARVGAACARCTRSRAARAWPARCAWARWRTGSRPRIEHLLARGARRAPPTSRRCRRAPTR